MAARTAIVTDSTAYLAPSSTGELGITVIPLSVTFDGHTYREGVDIDDDAFFALMRDRAGFPTTSQPPLGEFEQAYRRLLADHDDVVSLHLSGAISGTVETAAAAAAAIGATDRVHVVDSRRASIGLAPLVLIAADGAARGEPAAEIAARAVRIGAELDTVFYVDTLTYLQRGGRLTAAQAMVGETLRVKPLLTIDGPITQVARVRTRRRALERMLELAAESAGRGHPGAGVRAAVAHVQAPDAAADLVERVVAALPVEGTPTIRPFGPVIGAHLGPGALGLSWWPADE